MTTLKTKLFYSYCHADTSHREDMQKSLAPLKKNGDGEIDEWYDEKLVPGQQFNSKIKEKLEKANIIIFLVSRDFLASDACIKEWNIAKKQAKATGQKLISIIIRECAWKDFDNMKEYLALPKNGKPVTSWDNKDEAWQSVYNGIKDAIEDIRRDSLLRPEFKNQISSVEFISSKKENIQLEDLFVFPHISTDSEDDEMMEKPITNFEGIIKNKHAVIIGEDQSGKTTFCRKLFLHIVAKKKPVIFIDLNKISSRKPHHDIFRKFYEEQFNGDYSAWNSQENKTIILDNLSERDTKIRHVSFAKDNFENVFVATSNDYFYAHSKSEKELTSFTEIKINPLKGTHQEQLITKWMRLSEAGEVEHGKIDQMENQVNSIIISNKILPRYPFFILSILQTQEAFMPSDLNITLYGHCYHALIVAHLMKSGVDKDKVDSCFNFLRELAFFIHKEGNNLSISEEDYNRFQQIYEKEFVIKKNLIKKLHKGLTNEISGIINETSEKRYHFSWPYGYYFFLGQYLASNFLNNKKLIENMIEKVYLRDNSLSLIFTIHHAQNIEIIENILTHTLCALDGMQPAKLDYDETKVFSALLKDIPQRIISNKSVEEERKSEREDIQEYDTTGPEEESPHETVNEIYKLLKNMEILSQILKNKYGSLTQDSISNIVEIMSDAGLRLIKLLLLDEKGVNEFAQFLGKKWDELSHTDSNLKVSKSKQIKFLDKLVRMFMFFVTIRIIDKCANSINKKEIGEIVKNISTKKNTPAYDLIHYFYSLNTADKFENKHKQLLKDIISKNEASNGVLFRILSIRTQHYFNTHKAQNISTNKIKTHKSKTEEPLKQSVLYLLENPTKK